MPRKRREPSASDIKLARPDRSAPTDETLLQLAQERGLFKQADEATRNNNHKARKSNINGTGTGNDKEEEEEGFPPAVERFMEAFLWAVSMAMLHFTLDVLVQHQYAVEVQWPPILGRACQSFAVFLLLVYVLHPHPSTTTLLPGLPARHQPRLRQAVFFAASVVAGCYLIHITNEHGYLAVMKRAPTLGCLWIWSVIELDLGLAVASLACAGAFLWRGGYSIK